MINFRYFFLKLFPAFVTRFFIFRFFDSAQNDKKTKRALVKQDIKTKALERAKKSGNLRYIDARTEVSKDFLENVSLTEYYGTTKGNAFSSETAAKIYADQIYREVVPVPGQTKQ